MSRQTRVLALASCLLGLVVVPAPAHAKEVQALSLCGAADCVGARGDELSTTIIEGAPPTSPPHEPEPWYRARVTIGGGGHHESFRLIVLPRSGYLGGLGTAGYADDWMRINDRAAAVYRRLSRGLEPFPGSRLAIGDDDETPAPAPEPAPEASAVEQADDEGDGIAVAGIVAGVVLVGIAGLSLRRRHGRGE